MIFKYFQFDFRRAAAHSPSPPLVPSPDVGTNGNQVGAADERAHRAHGRDVRGEEASEGMHRGAIPDCDRDTCNFGRSHSSSLLRNFSCAAVFAMTAADFRFFSEYS